MFCPHCGCKDFILNYKEEGRDAKGQTVMGVRIIECKSCKQLVIESVGCVII